MGNENDYDRERAVRERIATLLESNERAGKKRVTTEEMQALKTAAGRLDQLLANAAQAETEELKSAAARLDQLLTNIAKTKGAGNSRRPRNTKTESKK
jgi:hypothetical protein